MVKKDNCKKTDKPPLKKEHFEVLLENMNDSIKLIAEGQTAFREEVNQRFDESDKRFLDFQIETRSNFKELFSFRDVALVKFDEIIGRLSAIENELKNIKSEVGRLNESKIDKKEFYLLKDQVARLENELGACKEMIKAKN